MPTASGFKCPRCGQSDLANVTSRDIVHILGLQCVNCQHKWAVESPFSDGTSVKK